MNNYIFGQISSKKKIIFYFNAEGYKNSSCLSKFVVNGMFIAHGM